MTLLALCVGVLVFQFEARLAVIKSGVFPFLLRVAGFALFAQTSLVHVVLAVAIIATGGGITMLFAGQMAGRASIFRRLVASLERKLGATMVEFALVQLDYSGLSPLVLRVAGTAHSIWNTAMVMRAITQVAGYLLVAVKA